MTPLSAQEITGGFVSSTSPLSSPANSLAPGSKNLLLVGTGKSLAWSGAALQASKVGGREMFNLPTGGFAGLGNGAGGGGSIVGLIARAIALIGSGPLTIDGVTTAISATTALQLLLYHSGAYDATAFVAGLDPPGAPTVAEHSANASTTNNGTTSARIHFVRSATGGRSRMGPVSNVITVTGKTVVLSVDAADLVVAAAMGYDRIGVDLVQWGFGATGPHYTFTEVAISSLATIDGHANSVELEWSSAELQGKDLGPIEDDPPPDGVFAVALEDVLAVIGAYGDLASGVSLANPGTAIAVSLKTFIESFPADYLLYMPGAPKGVLPRPSDGFAYVGGPDFMCALSYTGATPPLSLQTIWDGTGISAPGNMFLGKGGRLVVFTGQKGMCRIGEKGEPENSWSAPIADEVSAWTPEFVVGGWDDQYQLEVFFHRRSALAYNTRLDRWCAPLDLSTLLGANEVVCAAVTVAGRLYFATRDTVSTGSAVKVYTLHGGSGSTYTAKLAWVMSGSEADELLQLAIKLRSDNAARPVTVKVYGNDDETAPVLNVTRTLPRAGLQKLTLLPNLRGLGSYKVEVSQQSDGGDTGLDFVACKGVTSGVVTV
jgi:hypothetical protein